MLKRLFILLLFVVSLLHAQEATKANLSKLYVATFDRAPDSAGLKYWLNSGFTLEQVAMSFFDQNETQAKYPPSKTNAQFVKTIYQNLFDREPDDAGYIYWLTAINHGSIERSVFILAAINGALGDDAILLNNKMEVGVYFADKGLNDHKLSQDVMSIVTADSATVVKAKEMLDGGISEDPNSNEDASDTTPDTRDLVRYVAPEEVKSFPYDLNQIDGYESGMDESMLVGEINNQYWIRAFNRLTETEIREVVAQYNILTPVGYSDAHGLLVEIPVGDAEAIDALAKIELTRGITSVRKRIYLGSGRIKLQGQYKTNGIHDLPNDGGSPIDDSEGDNWHLGYINMPKAWSITTGNDDVWVGVNDGGFYPYHEDLCNKSQIIVPYKDPQCIDGNSIELLRTTKKHWHGTAVVGVIAARTNNSKGMTGINWHTKIVAAYFNKEEGETTKMSNERAFRSIFFERGKALTKVKLVNNSWALNIASSVDDAIRSQKGLKEVIELYNKKLFIIAAGNDSGRLGCKNANKTSGALHLRGTIVDFSIPNSSSTDNILIVGAIGKDGILASYSNCGDTVDIVAPAGMKSLNIVEDNGTSSYKVFNGTSASTPVVTGVASLIYSLNPDFTPQDIKNILIKSSSKKATHRKTGWGDTFVSTSVEQIPEGHDIPILDAGAALQMARDMMDGKILNVVHYYPSFFSPKCYILVSSTNQNLSLENPVLVVRGQRVDNDTLEAIDNNSLSDMQTVRSFNTSRIYKKYIIEGYVKINGITNATHFKNEFEDIGVVPVNIKDKATGEALNGAKITVESMNALNVVNELAKLFNKNFYEDKIVDGDTIDLYIQKDNSYRIIIEKEGYEKFSKIYTDDLTSLTIEMEPEGYVPSETTSTIKKTGQTKSYNKDGDEVTDGSIKDDGYYQKGVTPSYEREGDIVIDHITGLMWQNDESIKKPWVTQANYDARNYFDTSGDTATTYCANLRLGSYTDWRLPTSKELDGIVDYSKYNPAINPIFDSSSTNYYWSSTTLQGHSDHAWLVYFKNGRVCNCFYKYQDFLVRCVRVGE